MKNKAMMKARAPQRKPPNQWPRFFRNMLGQLDVAGDDPVFLAKDDIALEDQSYVASLMAYRLLSEEPSNSIACISCDAIAAVRRKGEKGEKASAVCPCCGAIFQSNAQELRRWRSANWRHNHSPDSSAAPDPSGRAPPPATQKCRWQRGRGSSPHSSPGRVNGRCAADRPNPGFCPAPYKSCRHSQAPARHRSQCPTPLVSSHAKDSNKELRRCAQFWIMVNTFVKT